MKKIAGIAGGLIGLRLVGIIHDIWLVVGLVALVLFWEFLVSQFPNYKKLINWGLGALLAVSLVTTVGHNIYISHVKPNIPFSSAASERALIGADLEATLRISPSMLDSRTALAGHLQEVQKHLGAQHYASLQKIQQQLTAGDLTTQEAWEKTQLILEEEQEYRAKMQNATDQLSAVRSPRSSGSKLALVGILLLLIAFIPKALPIPGKKACGGIGIALIVIVLILWALPGIKTATASVAGGIGGMFNSSSTPDQRGAN
ncbi:hypothetical protein KJ973_01445, partial [Patescibacteria group bacterium]|nr:hypothetical protein [Patescibacteria group bacterium]